MLSTYRLSVVNHFDNLVNEVDLKVETFLIDERLPLARRQQLNQTRDVFIEKIKQIEAYNLHQLQTLELEKAKSLAGDELNLVLFKKFCFLIDPSSIKMRKESIEKKFESVDLGYLIVIDKYLASYQLELYKELLRYHDSSSLLHFLNEFFIIKYDPVKFRSEKYCLFKFLIAYKILNMSR
jgi:hypothetical protein